MRRWVALLVVGLLTGCGGSSSTAPAGVPSTGTLELSVRALQERSLNLRINPSSDVLAVTVVGTPAASVTVPLQGTSQTVEVSGVPVGQHTVVVQSLDQRSGVVLDLVVLQVDVSLGTNQVAATLVPADNLVAQNINGSGVGTQSALSVDLNQDGRPDVVTTNRTSNTISIFLNTGNATFGPETLVPVGQGPIMTAALDINGDGKPDLVTTNSTSGDITVLLNTTPPGAATPTFAAPLTISLVGGVCGIATADINQDNKPDLEITDFNSHVLVLLNQTPTGGTTAAFSDPTSFTVGSGPIMVAALDVNGDHKPDLVVADFTSSDVAVLMNQTLAGGATPQFAPAVILATGGLEASWIAAGDFNQDGKPDVVVTNRGSDSMSILTNQTVPGSATPIFSTSRHSAPHGL